LISVFVSNFPECVRFSLFMICSSMNLTRGESNKQNTKNVVRVRRCESCCFVLFYKERGSLLLIISNTSFVSRFSVLLFLFCLTDIINLKEQKGTQRQTMYCFGCLPIVCSSKQYVFVTQLSHSVFMHIIKCVFIYSLLKCSQACEVFFCVLV
jgi:hypothetical protein